jgi:hypothetical protein
VATVGSVGVEGGEERKELEPEDYGEWNCWNLVLMRSDMKGIF